MTVPEQEFGTQWRKGRAGFGRILRAARFSLAGLHAAYIGEAAFRQLLWLAVLLIPIAFLLNVSRLERAMLIAVVLLALLVELLNSAIEAVVDRISMTLHSLSKQAKDMGSAAQMFALVIIAAVWGLILL